MLFLLPMSTPKQYPTRNYWPSESLTILPNIHNMKTSLACQVAKINPLYPSEHLVTSTSLPLPEIKFTDTPPYFSMIPLTSIFTTVAESFTPMEMVKTC